MRWTLLGMALALWFAAGPVQGADRSASHEEEVSLYGPVFRVSDLKFTVPMKWQVTPVENENRAGQWKVLPARGETGASGDVVVFFFGPNVGGSAKENIEGWTHAVTGPDGQPAIAKMTNRTTNGFKISQLAIFGTYTQASFVPGLPPEHHANYGLLGGVIESPKGNIYWRFTGPEPLLKANTALFTKILDSVKNVDTTKTVEK